MKVSLFRRHLAYAVAIAVTAAALALYTGSLIGRVSRRENNTRLLELAQMVERSIRRENTPLDQLDALADSLGSREIRVTLIREDGVVLGDSQADPDALENHADREEVRLARTGASASSSAWRRRPPRFGPSFGKRRSPSPWRPS